MVVAEQTAKIPEGNELWRTAATIELSTSVPRAP